MMSKRKFDELHVSSLGVQNYQDRFGDKSRPEDAPPIAYWRCNLTGLSQVQNLHFIAYESKIYVYIPQFPTQAVAEKPALIFDSQPSSPYLSGFLSSRRPHAINNLTVQFLGTEEVVAVVRDDGDVDTFLVRHIVQAIERRAGPSSDLGVSADEVRPFFQSNVGDSAWGLAIHAQARILATSSNAHEVRVFKFGLLQTEDDESSEGTDDEVLPDADGNAPEIGRGRKTDVVHHVINGQTNIPHIAFCNTGDDPEGRWLLTTDISGVCRVIDTSSLTPVQAFRFGRGFMTRGHGGFDTLNAGWTIMFLDRRSFREEDSVAAALGLDEVNSCKANAKVWDLSKTLERLPERSHPLKHYRKAKQQRKGHRSSGQSFVTGGGSEDPPETQEQAQMESDDESDGGAPVGSETDVTGEMQDYESDGSSDDSDDVSGAQLAPFSGREQSVSHDHPSEESNTTHTSSVSTQESLHPDPAASSSIPTHQNNTISSQGSDDSYSDSSDDLISHNDPDDEMTEDTISFTSWYNGESISANEPRFTIPTNLCTDLPCPILHTSVRNIYLLQPSNQQHELGPFSKPMIGFANPLRQAMQRQFAEYLPQFERVNMAASIPALGVVVLASQKGRALVLSLTKIRSYTPCPPEMQGARQEGKTVYATRAECILPFANQERENLRPFTPLHGIAVAPMQGCTNGRRWRLMMMWQDHSILSYEISRGSKGGVGIGDVIV